MSSGDPASRPDRFIEIPSTPPDIALSRELFARALSRRAPEGSLDAWVTLPETHAAALEIKHAIREYASAAMVAAVVDGYVPHATGFLDPLLADPLAEKTITRVLQDRAKAGFPVRKISRGPAMTTLQAAIQKLRAMVGMTIHRKGTVDDKFPFFNHAEYVLEFANLDRADWDATPGMMCTALRKAMLQIPFGQDLFRPIPEDAPRSANGQPSGFTHLRPDAGRALTGILVDDARILQWEQAWRKSSFADKLAKVIHPELVPYLYAPLGQAEVAHFRAELAAIQTIQWKLSVHDQKMLASMGWPAREDAPAWTAAEAESMRIILVTVALGERAQGAPRPMSMLPSDTNLITARDLADIFAWAKRVMKQRQTPLEGEEVPVVFSRTYPQVAGSWLTCCFADEIDRMGSLHWVLSKMYRGTHLERVNATKVVEEWCFVVPPLRTDGSLLDQHGAAVRLSRSHPGILPVTASDLADAYQNTTLPEYGGWTEISNLPFGQLLAPGTQEMPFDSSLETGQPSLEVQTDPVPSADPAQSEDEDEYHKLLRLQVASGVGLNTGSLIEMGLLDGDIPDSDIIPESVSSRNPDSQGGSQPARSDDADLQSLHSSDMPDGDTHIHSTDEDMPGLAASATSGSHVSTPGTSQPSTPRNAEDAVFHDAFTRIMEQRPNGVPLAPPFRQVDATAMMDEIMDRTKPMFGDDYRRALGELEIALGFTEEMMLLNITDWQMLKNLLEASTVSPAAQVLLLSGWQHRRDFVLAMQKAMDEKHIHIPITWIQPLSPRVPIERTVQPSRIHPRSEAARALRQPLSRRKPATPAEPTPVHGSAPTRERVGPDGSTPASTTKVLVLFGLVLSFSLKNVLLDCILLTALDQLFSQIIGICLILLICFESIDR